MLCSSSKRERKKTRERAKKKMQRRQQNQSKLKSNWNDELKMWHADRTQREREADNGMREWIFETRLIVLQSIQYVLIEMETIMVSWIYLFESVFGYGVRVCVCVSVVQSPYFFFFFEMKKKNSDLLIWHDYGKLVMWYFQPLRWRECHLNVSITRLLWNHHCICTRKQWNVECGGKILARINLV